MIQVRLLTEDDYYRLHGRPESPALRHNATVWLERSNRLLLLAAQDGVAPTDDELSGNPIASGFRPPGVNASTRNAATASTHLTCQGGDLDDCPRPAPSIYVPGLLLPARPLATWCITHLEHLAEIGIWMEDPRWTGGRIREDGSQRDPWCHWQTKAPGSGRRVYVPSSSPPQEPDFYTARGLAQPG